MSTNTNSKPSTNTPVNTTPVNTSDQGTNGTIILLEPEMRDLLIVKVEHVKSGDSEFIAITAREGSKIIPITCSIAKFEKMGIAAILPIGISSSLKAMVGISEIPNDGNRYGYRTKSGEVVAYERQGRYQLANVFSVDNSMNDAFKTLYGKDWNPTTASEDERDFYRTMLLQNLAR